MRTLTALLFAALAGCATIDPPVGDKSIVQVVWERYPTLPDVQRACASPNVMGAGLTGFAAFGHITADPNVIGCFRMIGNVCHVYTVAPKAADGGDPHEIDRTDSRTHEILGHEIRHCFTGRFHQSWD